MLLNESNNNTEWFETLNQIDINIWCYQSCTHM